MWQKMLIFVNSKSSPNYQGGQPRKASHSGSENSDATIQSHVLINSEARGNVLLYS